MTTRIANVSLFSTSAAAMAVSLLTGAAALAPQAAIAGPKEGVHCPSGFSASYHNDDDRLVCSRVKVIERDSLCSAVTASRGNIGVSYKMDYRVVPNGTDQCVSNDGGRAATQFIPLPGDPAHTQFVRRERADGRDYFEARVTEYRLPEGAVYNPLANAQQGVSCPGSFEGKRVANGLKCEAVTKIAVSACDFGWTLRVDDLQRDPDRCIGINGPGPTVPDGVFAAGKAADEALGADWRVTIRNNRDSWRRIEWRLPVTN